MSLATMIAERSITSWFEGRPCPRCNKSKTVCENGQFICSGCGAVLKEEFEPETGPRARVNSKSISPKLDRLSRRTFIGRSDAMAMKLPTIPLQRLDYDTQKSAQFNDYLIRTADYVDKLGLGTTVYEEAYGILIKARDKVLVRRYELATVASIYLACRKLQISRSLEDICTVLPQYDRWKALKVYRKLCDGLNEKPPSENLGGLLAGIAARAGVPEPVTRTALKMMQNLAGKQLFAGSTPRGFCAGLLCEAATTHHYKLQMPVIAKASNASNETIRRHSKNIRVALGGRTRIRATKKEKEIHTRNLMFLIAETNRRLRQRPFSFSTG